MASFDFIWINKFEFCQKSRKERSATCKEFFCTHRLQLSTSCQWAIKDMRLPSISHRGKPFPSLQAKTIPMTASTLRDSNILLIRFEYFSIFIEHFWLKLSWNSFTATVSAKTQYSTTSPSTSGRRTATAPIHIRRARKALPARYNHYSYVNTFLWTEKYKFDVKVHFVFFSRFMLDLTLGFAGRERTRTRS